MFSGETNTEVQVNVWSEKKTFIYLADVYMNIYADT